MAKAVLLRIDDRFLHGQIGRRWVPHVDADIIIVSNDEISSHNEEQKLMDLVTPVGATSYFLKVDETVEKLATLKEGKKALIIVESPKDAIKLIENGLSIDSINVGNMRNDGSKTKLNRSIYLDDEDIDYFKKLNEMGKSLDIRELPNADATDSKILTMSL